MNIETQTPVKQTREIVKIDREKCNGCGLCVSACEEAAIEIVDGKAELISEKYCDGLGACLGECPQDAITIEEREAAGFDEEAVNLHLRNTSAPKPLQCPSAAIRQFEKPSVSDKEPADDAASESMLSQWPIQLSLLPPDAPFFNDSDLVVCADCVPFAYSDFHRDFLRGKAIVIGCPKLDDTDYYEEKLTAMFEQSNIKSVTVLHMEVPCCFGIVRAAERALAASGKDIPFKDVTISIRGEKQ